MKYFTILPLFFLLLYIGMACAPTNLSYTEALDRNRRKLETEDQRQDAQFLVEAANANLLMSTISGRAKEEGYARIVVDFANTAYTDHQRMAEDLKKLAKDKKMSLPTAMSDQYQETINKLTTSDKRNFDKAYLETVENVHGRTIRLFEEAALNANDSNIRAFAAAKLDVMRAHARKARELENQLL